MSRLTTVRIASNLEKLSRLAADLFVSCAVEAVRRNGRFTVVLAGGSTPKSLYALLSSDREPYTANLAWQKMHFFWGDERHVPPDHPDSNYRMAREVMLSRVPIPSANIHRIQSELADAVEAADRYQQTLRKFFKLPAGQFPRFDLILLGMGPDGHIASLFPGSDAIKENSRLVAAPWIKKLESYRMTLTPPVLKNAAVVILLVSGSDKADVLREVLEGDFDPERLPAQLIRATSGKVLWSVDREAARLLKKTETELQA